MVHVGEDHAMGEGLRFAKTRSREKRESGKAEVANVDVEIESALLQCLTQKLWLALRVPLPLPLTPFYSHFPFQFTSSNRREANLSWVFLSFSFLFFF